MPPGVRTSPSTVTFPERTPITWRVRTYDAAGNATTSFRYSFTVDSTVPAAPTITAGPASFTNHNAPTFSWTGTLGAYAWSVSQAGAVTPVQSGQGGTSVTLAPLPDGDYTFQVVQRTPAGVSSDEATRSFQVDTVAPPAPAITARPSFPTALATPSFAWTAEEAAVFRWQVIGSTGASLQGPTDTPLPSATIGAVGPGAFSFRVWQIDPAGNVSAPTTDPFSVVGPVAGTRAAVHPHDPAPPQRVQALPARRHGGQDAHADPALEARRQGHDALQPPALQGHPEASGQGLGGAQGVHRFPEEDAHPSSRPRR